MLRGVPVVATDVDHISGDPSDNRRNNLQPLCHECHSSKTMQERNGRKAVVKGCNVDGIPVDPSHPWNEKSRTGQRQ
nr:HNH endonuclease signature motif containing protein [uncultured Luteimonas sp.]